MTLLAWCATTAVALTRVTTPLTARTVREVCTVWLTLCRCSTVACTSLSISFVADVWLWYDDDRVKVTTPSEVSCSQAYLLFYQTRAVSQGIPTGL